MQIYPHIFGSMHISSYTLRNEQIYIYMPTYVHTHVKPHRCYKCTHTHVLTFLQSEVLRSLSSVVRAEMIDLQLRGGGPLDHILPMLFFLMESFFQLIYVWPVFPSTAGNNCYLSLQVACNVLKAATQHTDIPR